MTTVIKVKSRKDDRLAGEFIVDEEQERIEEVKIYRPKIFDLNFQGADSDNYTYNHLQNIMKIYTYLDNGNYSLSDCLDKIEKDGMFYKTIPLLKITVDRD